MHEGIIRFDIIATQGRMNNNRLLIVGPLPMLRNRGGRYARQQAELFGRPPDFIKEG
jgi:hypothetical protein